MHNLPLLKLKEAKQALYKALQAMGESHLGDSAEDAELMNLLRSDSMIAPDVELEAPAKVPARHQMRFLGESIIAYDVREGETCVLGYLMDFQDKGVFSPDGKVEVTPDECRIHNAALEKAELEGLDKNCKVGMTGALYLIERDKRPTVQTFLGTVVSDDVTIKRGKVSFTRKGMCFTGRVDSESDLFRFKRTA